MPFLDDNGPDEDALRSPIWSVFALTKDNLERLIVLNLFWSVQLLPAFCALAVPVLGLAVRIVLILVSATLLAASTGVLFGMVRAVCEYEPVSIDLLRSMIRSQALLSLRKLAPLYGTPGLCLIAIVFSPLAPGAFFLQILVYYLMLTLIFCSFYWGPLFADDSQASSWLMFKRAGYLAWRRPGTTLISWLVILVLLAVGILSIVGLLLIVPVLIALLQTRRYQEVMELERQRRRGRQNALVARSH